MTNRNSAVVHSTGRRIVDNVERVLVGKTDAITLCLAALCAGGHVLIEDVPGVGKTILARSLALSIGASFRRVQFTPDLLPGDITGVHIYDTAAGTFEFRPGPVMTQVLLADEINRATPKTQSALLESMEERKLTLDGVTYDLPHPFIVIATQNPIEFEGTYPLPESQLDRFMISLRLGYPDRAQELRMLQNQEQHHPLDVLQPVISPAELMDLQEQVRGVYVDDRIRGYILDLAGITRERPEFRLGASPRATIALFRMAQAWACLQGRDYVLPDDVKATVGAVLRHRLMPAGFVDGPTGMDDMIRVTVQRVPVPGSRG